ncbi:MAG: 50S ribosomal protein L21 [Clostridia bacterium]|nr:MAG: 50S ribosomal protein L21 [Clostridia bacterium]
MYAIIQTGGKQYRVSEGQTLEIERLDAAPGETVVIDQVLAVRNDDGLMVGTPVVPEARVHVQVLRQKKGRKIVVFKYKPKKNYRRKQGHRQMLSQVQVEKISLGQGTP